MIDITQISLGTQAGALVLIGADGAVTPGSSLTALDLDTTSPADATPVDARGAFTLPLAGAATDVFRLQAFAATLGSDPVDVKGRMGILPGGPVVLAPGPVADCFVFTPALEVGPLAAGASATVKMSNGCASDVTVDALALRLGSKAWHVVGATPIVVPAGGSGSFQVSFDPHAGDAIDDVVLVHISAPTVGQRALTLRGQAP